MTRADTIEFRCLGFLLASSAVLPTLSNCPLSSEASVCFDKALVANL